MRSRYAAFALGLGAYLVETLCEDHPDRAEADLERSLGRIHDTRRFLGLRVVDATEDPSGRTGTVLFHARLFERGVDRSFAELSDFVREAGAWKYQGGVTLDGAALGAEAASFDRQRFLELAAALR